MPRNGSGTYTLPQPSFVSNTVISSSAMNSDLSDIASALTTSVCSDGQTTLTGAIKNPNGSAGTPGVSFAGDATTGLYLSSAGTLGLTAGGTSVGTSTSSTTAWALNTTVAGTLGVTGATTLSSTLGVTGALTVTSSTGTLGGLPISTSMALLNTLTASNSSTISDTSSLTSTYSSYMLLIENLLPSTGTPNLILQVHSGGAFKSTGYISSTLAFAGSSPTGASSTTSVVLAITANSSAPGITGIVFLAQPSASAITVFNGHTGYWNGTNASGTTFSGFWNTAAVVDGFQILAASGNLASGSVKIYGIV